MELGELLNISNNRFIRTTDSGHEQRAQVIWKSLKKDIYKDHYVGWYCTGDEAFFTETEVKANNGVCPNHNRPYEKLEEENYFFRLSKYSADINKAIATGALNIVPETRRNEILGVLKGGLQDISISRPKEKIEWGVPVPDDDNQVMYVWFEALMNYITVLGYPEHKDFKTYWPAQTQIIGKDILRFHAGMWPAMLMSLGLELPKQLYVHGFITVEGQKMSKSLGNVIHPADITQKYGVDAFRYYFLKHIPSYEDGNFSWERFDQAYNSELADELGNALQRTVAMLLRYQDGKIGEMPSAGHDSAPYHGALDEVWKHVRGLNQYIDQAKPWEVAKKGEPEHLREILAYQVASLLNIAELLTPFLPTTAQKIQAAFADGQVRQTEGTLFPKQDPEQDKDNKQA